MRVAFALSAFAFLAIRVADAAPHSSAARPGDRRSARAVTCPSDMVRIRDEETGTYCIDRYEWPNRRNAKPTVMVSAIDAQRLCATKGKRLCSEDEWIRACESKDKHSHPYGDEHEDSRCNDDRTWREKDEALMSKWTSTNPEEVKAAKAHVEALYQASRSGSKRGCKSKDGVFDLTGNVEEWVTSTRGHAHSKILIGCYWSGCYGGGKPTCHSTNSAHGESFRFYETGARCCKN